MDRPLYFDHHATTPLDPAVFAAMQPWYTHWFGNAAGANHAVGRRAAGAVAAARESLADDLGCDPDEVIFTSGATESNNLAIHGILSAAGLDGHFITTAAEHRAVLDPARRRQRRGTPINILPVDADGCVCPALVAAALRPETRLVSVMAANNEVGTLSDLVAIGRLCRERGIRLHTDAAQAFGRIPLDLRSLPVDLVSLTAHKLYGPQGIGALVVRRDGGRIPLQPLVDGGGHERGLRSGTLPVALIVGFAAAARLARQQLATEAVRLAALRDQLLAALRRRIDGLTPNGHLTRRLPGNLNVTIADVDGDALLVRLGQTELAVSSGAACSSANSDPSHVLRAIGRTDAEARSSLRFGLGRGTTAADVERAAEIVGDCTAALRAARR